MAGVAATIDGEAAPLWYVSPTQWNIQIPYETAAGTRDLEINNNGQVTHQSITVAAAAPGVFTDANSNISNGLPAVAAGQETVLYFTGAGAVSPSIATGAAPLAGTALERLAFPHTDNDDHGGGQARDSSPRVQRHHSGSGRRGAGQLHDSCRGSGGQAAGGGNRRRSAERNRLPDGRGAVNAVRLP